MILVCHHYLACVVVFYVLAFYLCLNDDLYASSPQMHTTTVHPGSKPRSELDSAAAEIGSVPILTLALAPVLALALLLLLALSLSLTLP
jgi:hypothetical protein